MYMLLRKGKKGCEATTQLIWRSGLSAPALSEWRKLLQSVAIG